MTNSLNPILALDTLIDKMILIKGFIIIIMLFPIMGSKYIISNIRLSKHRRVGKRCCSCIVPFLPAVSQFTPIVRHFLMSNSV